MTLDDVLRDPPMVHAWGAPNELSYSGFAREFYACMSDHIDSASSTLETGAGISTVVFALRRAHHTCVAPDVAELDRLKAYCSEKGIPIDSIDFQPMRSDEYFRLWTPRPLDLVLIDGCHGFPAPFLDWFHIAVSLRVGGLLVVDDTHLWTGKILKEFLETESGWRLERPHSTKTAMFRKIGAYVPWKEWTAQPYVSSRSDVRRPRHSRVRRALELARRGEYATLLRKVRKALF
jgi:predicted O-methyltransferase YrrM